MSETLEQAIKSKLSPLKLDISNNIMFIQGANFGAKWQQERSYSEEEVLILIKKGISAWRNEDYSDGVLETDKWFEQFKKK